MDPDKRIVPEQRVTYLLEEEHIEERTKIIKHKLIRSPKRIDKVADHWMESTGINSLARVMLKNVENIPHSHPTPTHIHHTPETHEHHGSHQKSHESHHAEHGHGDHHDVHLHDHHEDHGHHDHGHGSHGNEGHGHVHGNHGGHFSSFTSSGHWCGKQGARIFAMVGRIVGEIIGYIIKIFIVAILFGPTRTALLVLFICILLNTTMSTALPIGIAAGIAGIIHLIFTGIGMIGGHGGHGEGGHGGGHGGGHEHH